MLVLEDVDDAAVARAQELIDAVIIRVELDSFDSTLFIGATVETEHDTCTAEIRGSHTNFCHLEKNGEVILHKEYGEQAGGESPIKGYTIAELVSFARTAPIEDLEFMEAAYTLNRSLAEAGASWERCVVASRLRAPSTAPSPARK